MGLREIPATYDAFETWARDYDGAYFRFAESNRRIGSAPPATCSRPGIHACWRRSCLLDVAMLRAFGFPQPQPLSRGMTAGALRLRRQMVRWLPARRTAHGEFLYRSPQPDLAPGLPDRGTGAAAHAGAGRSVEGHCGPAAYLRQRPGPAASPAPASNRIDGSQPESRKRADVPHRHLAPRTSHLAPRTSTDGRPRLRHRAAVTLSWRRSMRLGIDSYIVKA